MSLNFQNKFEKNSQKENKDIAQFIENIANKGA